MSRRTIAVAVLVLGALAACSGGPGSQSSVGVASAGRSGSAGSASASPTPTGSSSSSSATGIISTLEALQAITAYNRANAKAANARSEKGARAIQTGPLLTSTLADFRYTKNAGKKPIRALAMSSSGAVVPAAGANGRWFIATSYSSRYQVNVVSLFEQSRAGAPWRKSLEILLSGSPFPDPTVSSAGAALPADQAGTVRSAAALTAIGRYLATGKKAAHMAVGPTAYVRTYLRKSLAALHHARSTLRCTPSRGARVAAVATSRGAEAVASLDCTLSQRADASWRIELQGRLKALANRSSDLRTVETRSIAQVAFTTSAAGAIRVLGVTFVTVGVTAH